MSTPYATRAQAELLALVKRRKETKVGWFRGLYVPLDQKEIPKLDVLSEKGYMKKVSDWKYGDYCYTVNEDTPISPKELAYRIGRKLKEWDAEFNDQLTGIEKYRDKPFEDLVHRPRCWVKGKSIMVLYKLHFPEMSMTLKEAEEYLKWIEGGGRNLHFRMQIG